MPSRCRAWAVCDVVCHLHIGAQDILVALATQSERPADTDYVSYWRDWQPGGATALHHARFVRLVASAYREPTGLADHFAKTSQAAVHQAQRADPRFRVGFQEKVFPVADFLTTFVVEAAIHHLDMLVELPDARRPSRRVLRLVRATLDGLLGVPGPSSWDDEQYALKATGRVALTDDDAATLGSLTDMFPLFG